MPNSQEKRGGKGSYLRERQTVREEESAVQERSRVCEEQHRRVERESGAVQRGKRRQFNWRSFTGTG